MAVTTRPGQSKNFFSLHFLPHLPPSPPEDPGRGEEGESRKPSPDPTPSHGEPPSLPISTPVTPSPRPPGESRDTGTDTTPSHGEPLPTPSTPLHTSRPYRSVPVIPRHDPPTRYGGAMIPRNPRGGRPDPFLPGGWTAYEGVGRVGKRWGGRGKGRKNF